MVSPMALIDFLAVAPFFAPAVVALDLRSLRALRLLRIFRIVRIARYSAAMRSLGYVFLSKKEELVISVTTILILLLVASSLMYFAEGEAQPDQFSSIPGTMWWGVATLTTVGYGDVYPVTVVGRILSAVVAILGIGLFAIPAGIVASGFIELASRNESERSCPHCGRLPGDRGI